jgi:hypothetical protein
MERTIKMQVDVPESFSRAIEHKLIDLKETGVKKTKAQYIIELAQAEFLSRTIKKEI